MKNLISISLVAVIASILVAACTGQGKTDNAQQEQQLKEDSVIVTAPEVPEVGRGWIIEDTVIGHWTVKATKDSNDVIVRIQDYDWTVRDSSVFLTLYYDNEVVYSDKEIRTKDIVGSEGEYIMQWGGDVVWASDSAIYLSFGCYLPDSDDGWNMLYQILPDGTSSIIVIEVGIGIEDFYVVADFMALYLNERAAGASAADLNRLYEHYCTKEVAEVLSAGTLQIVSDNTDFRHADRTTQIDNLDGFEGLPLERYSFQVQFKPNPNDDNITDILYMVVDRSTNKISTIEAGERKVI